MDQTLLRPIMRDVHVMPIAGDALVVRRDGRTLLDRAALTVVHGAGVTVIEWADKLRSLLPPETIHVHIEGVGDEPRAITIRT